MLDRDESGLLATQMSLTGQGLLQGDEVILANIRDPQALRSVFAAAKPDLVFHAAALKHLPLLETYPLEAWKTNVLGTLNVLTAAAEAGVGVFVNISTDKAADPTCVLGYQQAGGGAADGRLRRARTRAGTSRYGSATCWARAGPWCTPSPRRSSAAGRSRSPTRTSDGSSCSSPRRASWCSRRA